MASWGCATGVESRPASSRNHLKYFRECSLQTLGILRKPMFIPRNISGFTRSWAKARRLMLDHE